MTSPIPGGRNLSYSYFSKEGARGKRWRRLSEEERRAHKGLGLIVTKIAQTIVNQNVDADLFNQPDAVLEIRDNAVFIQSGGRERRIEVDDSTRGLLQRLPQLMKIEAQPEAVVQTPLSKFDTLIQQEHQNIQHLEEAIRSLEKASVPLRKYQFDTDRYTRALREALSLSNQILEKLQTLNTRLQRGESEQTVLEEYANFIGDRYGAYHEVWHQIEYLQKPMQGRFLNHPAFSLDVSAADTLHSQFIASLSDEERTERLADALTKMQGIQEVHPLPGESKIAREWNIQNARNLKLLQTIGFIASVFRTQRERCEAIMREQGLSDIETAYFMNFYEALYTKWESFHNKFQQVIQVANEGHVEDACFLYFELMKKDYIELVHATRPLLNTAEKMTELRFGEKAIFEGLEKPREFQIPTEASWPMPLSGFVMGKNEVDQIAKLVSREFPHSAALGDLASECTELFDRLGAEQNEKIRKTDFYRGGEEHILRFLEGISRYHDPSTPILARDMREFASDFGFYLHVTHTVNKYSEAIESESNPYKRVALQRALRRYAFIHFDRMSAIHSKLIHSGIITFLESLKLEIIRDSEGKPADKQQVLREQERLALVALVRETPAHVARIYRENEMPLLEEQEHLNAMRTLRVVINNDKEFANAIKDSENREHLKHMCTVMDESRGVYQNLMNRFALCRRDPHNPLYREALKEAKGDWQETQKKMYAIANHPRTAPIQEDLSLYKDALERRIHKVSTAIELARHTGDDAKANRSTLKLQQLRQNFELLRTFDISEQKRTMESAVFHEENIEDKSLWNKNYLAPLFQLGARRGEVKEIAIIFDGYRNALLDLTELSSQLEQDPLNRRVRSKLVDALNDKREALNRLHARCDAHFMKKIDAADTLLESAQIPLHLRNSLQELQKLTLDLYKSYGESF